jgi:hypothetical protein
MVPRTRLNITLYVHCLSCSSTIWPSICKETDIGNSYNIRQETRHIENSLRLLRKSSYDKPYTCLCCMYYNNLLQTTYCYCTPLQSITIWFSSLSQPNWIRICSQHLFVTSSTVITKLTPDKSYYTQNATYFNYDTFEYFRRLGCDVVQPGINFLPFRS